MIPIKVQKSSAIFFSDLTEESKNVLIEKAFFEESTSIPRKGFKPDWTMEEIFIPSKGLKFTLHRQRFFNWLIKEELIRHIMCKIDSDGIAKRQIILELINKFEMPNSFSSVYNKIRRRKIKAL